MKFFLTVIICLSFTYTSQSQFSDILKKAKSGILGEDESNVGLGLKEALEVGVEDAVDHLSRQDGYYVSPYKILIPEEARKVVDKLKYVPGFEDVEDNLIRKMNEAAELAAKKATPIFLHSIKQLTFKDAMNILMGEQDEATRYLEKTTRKELYAEFLPVIRISLDEVGAREYWRTAVNAYNKIPLTRDLNPELDDHVNNKALDGMFGYIEVKEVGIRSDVSQRTSPLLKQVFAKQDKKAD